MDKKVIGITGGIGCGKSVVMDLLEKEYGAAVILADMVGHDLMKPGAINFRGIIEHFGTDILQENGEIDRKKLGGIVFANKDNLEMLNKITHPNIIAEIGNRIRHYLNQESVPFVCLESAILFETNLSDLCDIVWYIYADKEVRIERLIEGRGYTEDYCNTVMAKQNPESYYTEKADSVINNSGSVDDTRLQIETLFK